jgi:hypothetical protein
MFKNFKEEWPYYLLCLVAAIIFFQSMSNMLSSPLTSDQMQEIKTKTTAYNLEFVSIESKQLLACGSGHWYRVPIQVKNKEGTIFTISYCSGSFSVPSQIKI